MAEGLASPSDSLFNGSCPIKRLPLIGHFAAFIGDDSSSESWLEITPTNETRKRENTLHQPSNIGQKNIN